MEETAFRVRDSGVRIQQMEEQGQVIRAILNGEW
jgi:hypothetical protein